MRPLHNQHSLSAAAGCYSTAAAIAVAAPASLDENDTICKNTIFGYDR